MNNLNPWDDAFRNSSANYDSDSSFLMNTAPSQTSQTEPAEDSDMIELDTDHAMRVTPRDRMQGGTRLGLPRNDSQRSLAHLLGNNEISFPDEPSAPIAFDFDTEQSLLFLESGEGRTVEVDQQLFNKLMMKNLKHILKATEELAPLVEKKRESEKQIEKAIHTLFRTRNTMKSEQEEGHELDDSFNLKLEDLARKIELLEENIEAYGKRSEKAEKTEDEDKNLPPPPPEKGSKRERVQFSSQGGLTNLGQTCWMNAVLQAIAHSPSRYYDPLSRHEDVAAIVADLRAGRPIDHTKLVACRQAFVQMSGTLPVASRYVVGAQFDPHEGLFVLSNRYLLNNETLPQPTRKIVTRLSDGSLFTRPDSEEIRLNANQAGISTQQMLQVFFSAVNLAQEEAQKQLVARDASNAVIQIVAAQTYKTSEARRLLQPATQTQTATQPITPEALLEKKKELFLNETQGATQIEVLYRASRQSVITALSDQVQLVVNRDGDSAVDTIDAQEEIDIGAFLEQPVQKKYRLDQVICRSGRSSIRDIKDNKPSYGHCYTFIYDGDGWTEYNDSMVCKHSNFAAVKDELNRNGYIFVYSKIA